jgi:sporulation protein YlmC with PRC-barrel domain
LKGFCPIKIAKTQQYFQPNTIERNQTQRVYFIYLGNLDTPKDDKEAIMSFADRDKYGMYKDYVESGPGPALMGADTLLGEDVVNNEEDDLGDIKEIMLDMRTGQVAYAVLSFGGFLGIGEKLFAVPWQALQLDTINKRFVLNVDKERLKSAPGFDKDDWPDMSDVSWANQIHAFYGTDPNRYGTTSIPGGMVGGASRGAGSTGRSYP